ncbi:MAG TPA: M23 family metallopeptidase [Gammaproteobacteria bacterium]|nr:M23 family metallopeptidase [Gammaproteobacteria bacterium]
MIRRSFRCSALLLAGVGAVIAARVAVAATLAEQPPPNGCVTVGAAPTAAPAAAPSTEFPPLQLEISTPFEPTAFPSAGRNYVIYELHLRNFDARALALTRVDVIDGSSAVASFEGRRLAALLQPSGAPSESSQLAGNGAVVAFVCLAFNGRAPENLSHRVQTDKGTAEGPMIGTQRTELRALGPPVQGANWSASSGPSNDSHHRVGMLVVDGRAQISRRYAIDWLQLENGGAFAGDESDVRSYHAYGEDVLAVDDGTVVTVIDGLPDNLPRTAAGFSTAVPMTRGTIGGNFIALDLGGGQFATYSHLQPGSLLVKQGNRVRRGQVLARVGNSGDARAPHLHFQVTTTASLFAGEGIPYVIDAYRAKPADGDWESRTNELPLSDMLVDFGDRRPSSEDDRPQRAPPRRTIRTEQ